MAARKGEEPSAGLLGEGGTSTSGQQTGRWGWVSLKGFQKHFDVDTEDVLSRMKNTLAGGFCRGSFIETTQDKADLYGPFWIATTLVFITAVSSNFQSYINEIEDADEKEKDDKGDDKGHNKWVSDYNKIPYAACLYYGYVFFLGLVLWATLKCFSSRMKLTQIWCIYGYSLTVFLPVSIVLILPSNHVVLKMLTVVLVVAAVLLSSIFLIRNFREDISTAAPGKSLVIMTIMVAFNVILGLVLLFYFQDVATT
ncbi:unnamed protein product [Ostreobium quekettii]|uniref:Protein YIP n=1 Tax=Ostreobium quekettii TaxID=121088 RepID=A0A8S1IKX5_9CHLO|nr:unnamed protein product [Ostreobium quekettii]